MSERDYLLARVSKDIQIRDESGVRASYRGVKNSQGKWELRALDDKGRPGKAVDRISSPGAAHPTPHPTPLSRANPTDRLRRKRANNVRNSAALAGGGATAFGAAGLMHMQGERKMWDAATAPAHMFKDTAWDKGARQVRRAGVLGRTGKVAMLAAVPFAGAAGVRHAQLKRAQRG